MNMTGILNYIDKLRYERNLTREELIDGITSTATYNRYLNGDTKATVDVILKLTERLGFSTKNLLETYFTTFKSTSDDITAYFNYVLHRDDEQAKKYLQKIQSNHNLDIPQLKALKIVQALDKNNKGRSNTEQLVEELKVIIDFDKIQNHEAFADFELYTLGLIMSLSETDRSRMLKKLLELNEQDKLFRTHNVYSTSRMYYWLIKFLLKENEYESMLELTKSAIDFCEKRYSTFLITEFYYFKSLVLHKLGRIEEFEESNLKLKKYLSLTENDSKYKIIEELKSKTGYNISA